MPDPTRPEAPLDRLSERDRLGRIHSGGWPKETPEMTLARMWKSMSPEPNTGCWVWNGTRTALGYGQMSLRGKRVLCHRATYELLVGPIPEGLELDHLCRVPSCCNPSHLEAVTHWENLMRGTAPTAINARKTECSAGHPLAGDNLMIKSGKRACRECQRRQQREAWPARKARGRSTNGKQA